VKIFRLGAEKTEMHYDSSSMGKATRAAWYGIWLLCALFVGASLDSLPDPLAVKSRTSEVRASGFDYQPLGFAGGEPKCHAGMTGPRLVTRWSALKYVFEARLPILEVALVRQAADPSPPPFARS
jgi:hypothetical protein